MVAPQMSDSVALHTAARRFAIQRVESLDPEHQGLADGSAIGFILDAVEKLDPAKLDDLASTREQVISAARSARDSHVADSMRTQVAAGEVRKEFDAEFGAFCAYVTSLSQFDLAAVEPLPFRRYIENAEAEELWQRVKERWNPSTILRNYDRLFRPCSSEVPVLEERAFFDTFDASALRDILASRGVARVWRFTWGSHELDDYAYLVAYELDLSLITPDIGWDSWTSPELDWVIHVRQSGRVAILGGWISNVVTSKWPSWRDHVA